MGTSQQLDLTLINGYLQALSLDVIKQMMDLYVQQSKVYLTEISRAIHFNDDKAWQEQCHKMKGSAASAGLVQVYAKLVVIEKSTDDVTIKQGYLHELTMLNTEAIDALQQWLATQ